MNLYRDNLKTGDGTSDVQNINLNDKPTRRGHTGLWRCGTFYVGGSGTTTCSLQGRMTETDEWLTLATITEVELGTAAGVNAFLMEVTFLPYARVTVSNSHNAGNLNVNFFQV